MTVLRVLLPGAPAADRDYAWALHDEAGALLRRGRDRPADWPDADRREAVLAASLARIAVVTLPPLPPARVAAAVAFALEDALAGAPDSQRLVAGRQGIDGRVPVTIVARAALAPLADCVPPFARVVAEPELAAPAIAAGGPAARPVWRWCQGAGDGFVRTADGGAFAVTALGPDRALPAELAQALASAVAQGAVPTVRAEVDGAAGSTARWQQQTGVTFAPAAPWQWDAVAAALFAAAHDLAEPRAGGATAAAATPWRLLRPAAFVAAAAVALHVAATAGEWVAGSIRASRDRAAWVELARDAGASGDAATGPRPMPPARRWHSATRRRGTRADCPRPTMRGRCWRARRRRWRRCRPERCAAPPTPAVPGPSNSPRSTPRRSAPSTRGSRPPARPALAASSAAGVRLRIGGS